MEYFRKFYSVYLLIFVMYDSTIAFDEASPSMQNSPFEARFEFMMENVTHPHPFIVSLLHTYYIITEKLT